jgi:D-arabinose 1-dehydrogenase-like Zn-dependent alcohol dehydrogenase
MARHELVGLVVRMGSQVDPEKFRLGDRVGVGPNASSCNACRDCLRGGHVYCPQGTATYGSLRPDGTVTQGGFASIHRTVLLTVFYFSVH